MEQLNAVTKKPEPGMQNEERSFCESRQFSGVIWKYCVGLMIAVCVSFIAKAQPVISSFTPASGPVGTSVTITGSGFGATAADNIVYFGAVKATITAASAGALTVTVPSGASYAPVSVTASGLIAHSKEFYTPTFITCYSIITNTTPFTSAVTAPSSNAGTRINNADLDGDGKPDLVTFNNNSVNLFLNTTTISGGDITFATKQALTLPGGTSGHQHYGAVVADLDGDGKPDIAFVNNNNSRVLIYRNQSSVGALSFATATVYTGFSTPTGVTAGDFNGDGKTDLAVINAGNNTVSFLRNNSSVGAISFAINGTAVSTGSSPFHILSTDLDGDGKPDLAVTNSASNTVSTFLNTYSGGNISFGAGSQTTVGNTPQGIAVGDFDRNGISDLVVVNGGANTISFLRNISTTASISFATSTFTPSGSTSVYGRVSVGDLDGDGKPDIAVGSNASAIYCFKNTSPASGTISFDNTTVPVPIGVSGGQPIGLCIGDFNDDDRPDIADVNAGSASVDVFINKINKVVVTSLSDVTGTKDMPITILGTGLKCITGVTIGGVAADFQSADENTVKVKAGDGATGNVVLLTDNGGQYVGPVFTFVIAPTNLAYGALTKDTTVVFGTESFTSSPTLNDGGGGIKYTIESGAVTGININTNTGQVGWIASLQVGVYPLTVKAENSAGSVTTTITIRVKPGKPANITYLSSPYSTTFGTAGITDEPGVDWLGQTGTFSLGTVNPASSGITINATTGAVSWNSSVAVASYTIPVRATNAGGTGTVNIILKVLPLTPQNLSYPTPNPLTIKYGNAGGVDPNTTLDWHGQSGTFAIITTGLPAGITINTTTGRISWSNTVPAGSYTIQVTATNTAGTSLPATFSLIIEAEAPTDLAYTSPEYGDFSVAGSSAAPTINWHGSTVSYAITNTAAIPAGIVIDAASGVISWPSTLLVGSYVIKVRAQNAIGFSDEVSVTLTIRPLVPTGLAYNAISPVAFGTAGSVDITSTINWHGQTGTFSVTNAAALPAGITINAATGTISWDGTVPVGTYSIQSRATNDRGYQQITVTLVVFAEPPTDLVYTPPSFTADYGKADSILNIPAINWHGDNGTFSIVSVSPSPTAGSIGVSATGRINWTANLAVKNYTVTVRATNSKGSIDVTYTLNIQAKIPVDLKYTPDFISRTVGVAGASAKPTVNWGGETGAFETSGTYPSDITINTTTGIISWTNTLAVGEYYVKVKARNSVGASDEVTYTITIKPLAPTSFSYTDGGETSYFNEAGTSRLPNADLGGGTGTYTIEPAGSVSPEITINGTTGAISWTKNLALGNYTFTVKVDNGTGTLTTTFTLKVVVGPAGGFKYTPDNSKLGFGNAGSSVAPEVNWHGETGTFGITGAPAGVTINATTGVISWTNDLAVGSYTLNLTAKNSLSPAATTTYTLKITGAAPSGLSYSTDFANVDAGTEGKSVLPAINWHGETGTFVIVNAASLPADITIDADGYIHWSDNLIVNTYSIQVRGENTSGNSNTVTYTLSVASGKPTITYTPPGSAVLMGGTGVSATPVIKWNSSINSGNIDEANKTYPDGLVSLDGTTGVMHFDATGITTPTTYSILIAVANAETKQGFTTYTLTVGGVPTNLVYSTVGYDVLEGTSLNSVKPTVNWNGVTGTFKLSGAPAGVSIDETTGIITFGSTVKADTYNFTVTAESSLGSSNAVNINLKVIALADATITGGSTVCSGVESSLTVNLTGTAPWAFTYSDGTTVSSVTDVTSSPYILKVKPTETTTYTITSVTDENGTNNTITPVTDNTTITVMTSPTASINPVAICLGSSVTLTATGGSGYVYSWSNGTAGATTTATTSGDYTVTVTDVNSCTATSAVLKVKLNTIPTAKLNKPSNTLICEGNNKPLTATGGTTYNWYKDDVLVKDSIKATYYASGEGSYTVEAVSTEGCVAKATDVVVLQFAKKPTANFTYDTYCRDVDINFTNTSDEGGGEILYKWVFDTDNASTEKEPVFAYSTAGAKTITLTATSKVCPDLTNTKTVKLTVEEPAPSQRYEAINAIVGRSVTLKAQAKGNSYTWVSKDGLNTGLSDASVEQPTLKVAKEDTYTVTIATNAGCVTVDTQLVRIFNGAQIFVPKAFTPNNDGVNDKLYPIPVGVPQITYFRVFNRWGVLMYETKQAGTPGNGVGWDGTYKGKQQPFDTYTWVAEGIDLDGKPVKLSGNSVLLR